MTASVAKVAGTSGEAALRGIAEREEILEICYWYKGEGFGERFTVAALAPFLAKGQAEIGVIIEALVADGALLRDGLGYRLSDTGTKAAGRLFHDTFTEFQLGSHGECTAGCCDGDDHSQCAHEHTDGQAHTHTHKHR